MNSVKIISTEGAIFYVICTIHFMLFNINNLPVVVAVAVVVFVLAVVRKEMMDIKGSDHN